MAKSLLDRLSAEDYALIKERVYYDPSSPTGLRWRDIARLIAGRQAPKGGVAGSGKTLFVESNTYPCAAVVMLLNDIWPEDGQNVVTREDPCGPWGDVANLEWANHGEGRRRSAKAARVTLVRSVLGNDGPDLGDRFRLNAPCPNGHLWNGQQLGLQRKSGQSWRCDECAKERDQEKRNSVASVAWRKANKEKLRKDAMARAARRMAEDPEGERRRLKERQQKRVESGKVREYKAKYRETLKVQGLTTRGTTPIHTPEKALQRALERAIRSAGRLSIPRLVMNEQLLYWRENPQAKRDHKRQWDNYIYAFQYKCDLSFRRHECQRNSEKKARNRGNHTVRLCPGDIDVRFAEFDNQCAFCSSSDRLIVEHFIPRSKGGPHAIGNILPACHSCNTSKFNHDPEEWYRRQAFFTQARWRKILKVLGKRKGSVAQLPLL
jgi:hypothetical protein